MGSDHITVQPASRQVIEKKLLTALEDEGCCAVLATRKDLDLLIHALTFVGNGDAREMEESLRTLRREVFGANNQSNT